MARVALDHQVDSLQQELVVLACNVEKAINRAVDALKRRDLDASRQVVLEDDYIDQQRLQIEERCVDVIATQQPMGRDVRAIINLLHDLVEMDLLHGHVVGLGLGFSKHPKHRFGIVPGDVRQVGTVQDLEDLRQVPVAHITARALHQEARSGDALAADPLSIDGDAGEVQGGSGSPQVPKWKTLVEQGSNPHVAGHAGEAVQIADAHRRTPFKRFSERHLRAYGRGPKAPAAAPDSGSAGGPGTPAHGH